ncbi:hypothetical protein [Amycolatopsis sulphurea]|uniref:hypothetical protein n=1 Tax=Amycolatopsis sulphurea TaxID=76022 RepID=UPI001FEB621A|nr:hypothetical protein [Amycolatopsis sulphurea]
MPTVAVAAVNESAFVSTIAYSGFLAGPPLIGGIAQATSLPVSFLIVGLIAALIVPAAIGAARAARHDRVPVGLIQRQRPTPVPRQMGQS